MANPHSAKNVTDYDFSVTRSPKSRKAKSVTIEIWYGDEDIPVRIDLPFSTFLDLAGDLIAQGGSPW